jgi:sugar lactone lactonase YvrE
MRKPDIDRVLRSGALNGECPTWSVSESKLYWVDVKGSALHVFDPHTGEDEAWCMPAWIGCCALTERGAIVALRTGLYAFDRYSGALELLRSTPYDPRRFTFNDGRCDPRGRFFVGPMYSPLAPGDQQSGAEQRAPLWRFTGERGWCPIGRPLRIANGLAFSPDGRILYHCDTALKTIWASDYDPESAEIDNTRVFAQVVEGGSGGGPDGASVDRDGFYTCAVFGAGCLLRFDPAGKLERRIAMPAQYVTMPAFGGDDGSTMYVTSAAFPLTADERLQRPDEGSLFALEAPVPGLPPTRFSTQQETYPS